MGIDNAWKDLQFQRISLKRFSAEWWSAYNRSPRIAVDAYQWILQIKSNPYGGADTRGFANLWIRRLIMFASLGYSMVIVFDGPSRPTVKRDRARNSRCEDLSEVALAIQICMEMGVPVVQAPGEAEAECAVLQCEDVVDYVFSTDADTMLFGARKIMFFEDSISGTVQPTSPPSLEADNNPSSSQNSSDTAENDTRWIKILERDVNEHPRSEYLLRVLLSGGDYDAEGVPGIGSETARQAARSHTGFAQDLVAIYNSDWMETPNRNNPTTKADDSFDEDSDIPFTDPQNAYEGDYETYDGERQLLLDSWRQRFNHELHTNEHSYFSYRHPSIEIPESFPNTKIIYRYCFPLVNEYSPGLINSFIAPKLPNLKRIFARFQLNSEFLLIPEAGKSKDVTELPPDWVTWRLVNLLTLPCLLLHITNNTDKLEWYKSLRVKRRKVERSYTEYSVVLNEQYLLNILDEPVPSRALPPPKRAEKLILGPILKRSQYFKLLEQKFCKPIQAKSASGRSKKAYVPKNNMQITQFFKVSKKPTALINTTKKGH